MGKYRRQTVSQEEMNQAWADIKCLRQLINNIEKVLKKHDLIYQNLPERKEIDSFYIAPNRTAELKGLQGLVEEIMKKLGLEIKHVAPEPIKILLTPDSMLIPHLTITKEDPAATTTVKRVLEKRQQVQEERDRDLPGEIAGLQRAAEIVRANQVINDSIATQDEEQERIRDEVSNRLLGIEKLICDEIIAKYHAELALNRRYMGDSKDADS